MFEKNYILQQILQTHLKKIDIELCKELRTNCYSNILINTSNNEIMKEIIEYKNNII
jgi:hypothetical protein